MIQDQQRWILDLNLICGLGINWHGNAGDVMYCGIQGILVSKTDGKNTT